MECYRTHESSKMMVWIRMDNGVVPHHIDILFGESSLSILCWSILGTLKDHFNHIAGFR